MSNKVLQFEGDVRLFKLATDGTKTPVNPDPTDDTGNTPVEASGAVFSYAAGDQQTVISHRRDRYKQTIYSDQDPGTPSIEITMVAVPAALIARMFYGDDTVTEIVTGAFTDESVTVVALDAPIALAHRYLKDTPAVVVKDSTGTTTYVAGTDYTVDLSRGTVTAKTGGAIDAADVIKVSGSYNAYELVEIRGGVKPTETFYITGDMLNRPDKTDLEFEIYQAVLSSSGDVDLFSEKPLTLTLKGDLITPDDKTEPFITRKYTPA